MNQLADIIDRIHCCDCLEFMKDMPDGCVDLVWTDPPYNVGKDYGEYKDRLTDRGYLAKCADWIVEMKRVSGNRLVVFVPQKYKLDWWQMLGGDYKEIILSWSPEGALRGNYCNQFSTLLTNVRPVRYTKNVWHNCQMTGLGWFFREDNYGHPGYTSEDITTRVLMSFSEPDHIVLDPCGGTGTTGVICNKYERRFITIELDGKWSEFARKRIAQASEQQKLALK